MSIKLIIGLQNPGSVYEQTRHNAGGWFVEALVHAHKGSFRIEKKLHAKMSLLEIATHTCWTVLPTTFMNESGLSARESSHFYRISPDNILVVHDDLDLPAGRIKLKTAGGNGGHNGLRDITSQLGCNTFHRLRIGIGHPGHKDKVLNYVLGKPTQQERELIQAAIVRGIAIVPMLLSEPIMHAMNVLNKEGPHGI